jgi:phosphotransferase system  glucose/maltose/N-acetylglucosamine-specific IIC component
MMETVRSFLKGILDVAMAVIPVSVVLGVIFGPAVPFIGADTLDNISALVADLGGSGLVGIITLGILYALWNR